MTYFKLDDETESAAIYRTVWATFTAAIETAAERVIIPEAFPSIPVDADAHYWTRRLLAELLDAGYAPDGWQESYLKRWGDV